MRKNYILNTNTGVLHYRGYCNRIWCSPDKLNNNYKKFDSENDAKSNCPLSIRWCRACSKKREKELNLKNIMKGKF